MTDRELLELAAKAAGMGRYSEGVLTGVGLYKTDSGWVEWNPLADDGDAFRLAVKLEMQVIIGFRRIDASICSDSDEPSIIACAPKVGDHYAATRRAIVRAAAELGRDTP